MKKEKEAPATDESIGTIKVTPWSASLPGTDETEKIEPTKEQTPLPTEKEIMNILVTPWLHELPETNEPQMIESAEENITLPEQEKHTGIVAPFEPIPLSKEPTETVLAAKETTAPNQAIEYIAIHKAVFIIIGCFFIASLSLFIFFLNYLPLLSFRPTVNEVSPYRVSTSLISTDGYLSIEINAPETVGITHWKLKNDSGQKVFLGKTSILPHFGKVNETTPTKITGAFTLIIQNGQSPIGVSFAVNKCSSYLSQFQEYTPPISTENCPMDLFPPDTACKAFVSGIPTCQTFRKTLPGNLSAACRDYINTHMNYNGCVADHKNDADFYTGEWRIFLGQDGELFKKGETIILLDAVGDVIAEVEY